MTLLLIVQETPNGASGGSSGGSSTSDGGAVIGGVIGAVVLTIVIIIVLVVVIVCVRRSQDGKIKFSDSNESIHGKALIVRYLHVPCLHSNNACMYMIR